MRSFYRNYNKNRKFIWFILATCIAIISLIHIINNEFKLEYIDVRSNDNEIIREQFHDTSHSVMTSQKIDPITGNNTIDVIKQFIDYCNVGKVESAYNLLSQDCKNVLYPTLEIFKSDYHNINFAERKTYNLQSWLIHNNKFIYKIELMEDMLAEGKVSNIKKKDYYTVIRDDNNYYLNISGFIEKDNIKSLKKVDTMEFYVDSIDVFMEYLNLNIAITNNGKKDILLDSGKKTDTVLIKDLEGKEFKSYLFEYNNLDLIISKKTSKNFKIKFMKSYDFDNKVETIYFKDIILDYAGNNDSLNVIIDI